MRKKKELFYPSKKGFQSGGFTVSLRGLKATPKLKIDLHVHTDHSDSISSVEEVLVSARKKKLDGIAITDHDTITAVPIAFKKAQDLIIIPGIEVETTDGHILVLGLKEPIPKGLNSVEVAEYAKKEGCVVVIAHPNVLLRSFNEVVIKSIEPDAIETHNAKTTFSRWMRRKNIQLANRLGLPQTGGSDSHMHQTVGDMYTVINANTRSVEDVLDAIMNGNITPAGKASTIWEKPIRYGTIVYRTLQKIGKTIINRQI